MRKIITLLFVVLSIQINAQNLITNPGFENGLNDWSDAGADSYTLETSNVLASTNAVRIVVSTQKYNGIRPSDANIALVPGDYNVSFYVKAADENTVGKKASIKVVSNIGGATDESGNIILTSDWQMFSKSFTVANADEVKVLIRANNVAQTGMDIYVDNVEMAQQVTSNLNGDFESAPITFNWSNMGTGVIHKTHHADSIRNGLNACVVTVNASNDGLTQKEHLVQDGIGSYTLTAWVKGVAGEPCQLRATVKNDGVTTYPTTDHVIASTGVWEPIKVDFEITDVAGTAKPIFRQNTYDTPATFVIDDINLTKNVDLPLLYNGDFEASPYNDGWVFGSNANGMQETVTVHGGSSAIKITPTDSKQGLKSDDFNTNLPTGAYIASAWVKGAATNEVKIQMQVKDASAATQYIANAFNDELAGSDWQHVSMYFGIPSTGAGDYKFNFQPITTGVDFILDDFSIDSISSINPTFINGDMENGVDMYYSDVLLDNGAVATITNEESDVNGGSKAMKIDVSTATGDWSDVQTQTYSLVPFNGSAKVVSFYAKATANNPSETPVAGFTFGYKDEIGKPVSGDGAYNGKFSLNSTYRQYNFAIAALDYNASKYALANFRCGQTAGEYFLDDITISDYDGIAPTISSSAITTGIVNAAYTYTPSCSKSGALWSISATTVYGDDYANWMSFDEYTGEISGTPSLAGVYNITLTYNDGIQSVDQQFELTIGYPTNNSENSLSKLAVYPNPATHSIQLSPNNFSKYTVYSINGKTMLSGYLTNNRIVISNLPKGVYFLSLTSDKTKTVIKFNKE